MSSSKRPASTAFASSNTPSAKRAAPSGTLGSYFPSLTGPAQPPSPVLASDPLTDRASTFVAHAAPCTNRVQAQTLQAHVRALRNKDHPVECSHEVLGWRCMALKPGRSGLESEDDWKVEGGADDDGEKGAGAVVKEVLEKEGGVDCAIVVSRLYGGIMLGPVRFTHIRTVASQALSRLLITQRLTALRAELRTLDGAIAALSPSPVKSVPAAQYAGLTVEKADRLVAAREKRLGLLEKKRREEEEALWRAVEGEEAVADGGGEQEGEGGGQDNAQGEAGAPANEGEAPAEKEETALETEGKADEAGGGFLPAEEEKEEEEEEAQ